MIKNVREKIIFYFLFTFIICNNVLSAAVKSGIDVFFEKYLESFKDKKLGVIVNQTSVNKDGKHLIDLLLKQDQNLIAIFTPEHGLNGEFADGVKISDGFFEYFDKNIPIISLYGKIKKPTPEMLKDIDFLIYDIEDLGLRFYTFITTLGLVMEAANENDKKFIIFDRPVSIRADIIEGSILKPGFESFVGKYSSDSAKQISLSVYLKAEPIFFLRVHHSQVDFCSPHYYLLMVNQRYFRFSQVLRIMREII